MNSCQDLFPEGMMEVFLEIINGLSKAIRNKFSSWIFGNVLYMDLRVFLKVLRLGIIHFVCAQNFPKN